MKSKIKKILKRTFNGPPSEIEKLIESASLFPRYKKHEFTFNAMTFMVTDFLSVAYQLKEFFVEQRMFFPTKNDNPLIYDCGANVGVASIYFKKTYPNSIIKSFEPDAKAFECLQKNILANAPTGVELFNSAVWINNDGIEFGSEGADGGSIFFEGNKTKVSSVNLAALLQNEKHIDLLKMDIEGAEMSVLLSCSDQLHKVNYLFVEYHSWQKNEQELHKLLQLLTEKGFRYYIQSIGSETKQPFIRHKFENGMDIQLDIHAINNNF
ncbi:MAG TPA: FkbM family methyltransferase [Bacteroidia bacterium]|nr:FkbM family methyltransferase [Bacteroidia bacterium]